MTICHFKIQLDPTRNGSLDLNKLLVKQQYQRYDRQSDVAPDSVVASENREAYGANHPTIASDRRPS